MSTVAAAELMTVGQLCDFLSQPQHRVLWVIETRHIAPAARAKHYRLFSIEQAEQIRGILAAIDARKAQAGAS